ncbi:MAG: hypothetical protein E7438_05470 [Ruminococcaceae bacterium]|nr:hypothetical protein [Oscillospiraceae bacterium]
MNKEQLYEALGDIHEAYIAQADQPAKRKKRSAWLEWSTIAACLCLVVTVLVMPRILSDRNTASTLENPYATAAAYAEFSSNPSIHEGASNRDLLGDPQHWQLPVFALDTQADLAQFRNRYASVLSLDRSADGLPSFEEVLREQQWGEEAFFAEYTLLVIYMTSSSGSRYYGVNSITVTRRSLCLHVEQINDPQIETCDMAGRFIMLAIKDAEIREYTTVSADFLKKE